MADQFDKMQKLPDPLPGAPNFHRIPGYKVYTTGQPALEGIKNILEKVTGTIYPKDGPIIWLNLRQEPDVYVNGQPICARPPNKIEDPLRSHGGCQGRLPWPGSLACSCLQLCLPSGDLLKMDKYKMDPAKDPLFRGEFPVVLA